MERDIERTKTVLARLEENEKALKKVLDAVESSNAGEIERKKESVLYERIVEMQAAIKSLLLHRSNLEGHVSDLSSILGDLSRDFNPNYQDMAVLGASRAFKDWQKLNGQLTETDSEETAEEAGKVEESKGEDTSVSFTDQELQTMEDEDPLSLIDSLSSRVGSPALVSASSLLYKIEEYLPESWHPQFLEYKKQLAELLARTGLIHSPSSYDNADSADRPELAKARSAHTNVHVELSSSRDRLNTLEQNFAKDW